MDEIEIAINQARTTNVLHLSYSNLHTIPHEVFKLKNLIRLDLGCNNIRQLPREVGKLKKLEELWLNNNPIDSLPVELENCKRLKQVDLNHTKIVSLPRELSRLKNILEIDLENCSDAKNKLKLQYNEGGTKQVMEYLRLKDLKTNLKTQLNDRFKEGLYRELADDPIGMEKIEKLTKAVFKEYTDYEDIKNVLRNCERLFPQNIDKANVSLIRKNYDALQRDNMKKRLAAELELKLRNIYFDRIDPSNVEGIVRSLYLEITTLENIQFLIKYAAKIFPDNSEDIQAVEVKASLIALQKQMAEERHDAIQLVVNALKSVYPQIEPEKNLKLAQLVCTQFKKVQDIKKLAADATTHFPSEYEAALTDPKSIRRSFRMLESEK